MRVKLSAELYGVCLCEMFKTLSQSVKNSKPKQTCSCQLKQVN